MMVVIQYKKKSCIGAGECEAVSPALWKVLNDGKAELKGAKLNEDTGLYELEVDDALVKEQELVIRSCPANCITLRR